MSSITIMDSANLNSLQMMNKINETIVDLNRFTSNINVVGDSLGNVNVSWSIPRFNSDITTNTSRRHIYLTYGYFTLGLATNTNDNYFATGNIWHSLSNNAIKCTELFNQSIYYNSGLTLDTDQNGRFNNARRYLLADGFITFYSPKYWFTTGEGDHYGSTVGRYNVQLVFDQRESIDSSKKRVNNFSISDITLEDVINGRVIIKFHKTSDMYNHYSAFVPLIQWSNGLYLGIGRRFGDGVNYDYMESVQSNASVVNWSYITNI